MCTSLSLYLSLCACSCFTLIHLVGNNVSSIFHNETWNVDLGRSNSHRTFETENHFRLNKFICIAFLSVSHSIILFFVVVVVVVVFLLSIFTWNFKRIRNIALDLATSDVDVHHDLRFLQQIWVADIGPTFRGTRNGTSSDAHINRFLGVVIGISSIKFQ